MIINQDNQEVKSVGFEDSPQMKIKQENLHKIYRLLTTSSYKDVYSSIIREYTMNAVDSNYSAGKSDQPVYVKYNSNDNSISIIDNGLGMSEEFIYDVYMSLGDSTKDMDAENIGGFGIGAKSWFSYEKSYILISRYNGEIKTYLIAENESGLPDATLMNVEETSECNGVEVKFTLKNYHQDYHKFKKAVEDQLKYTKNVIIEGFGISNDYKIIQGKHFVYRPDRHNVTGYLELNWGSVCYPISYTYLGVDPIYINCALYFPQNTPFQPEAARENLRNTESNKKLILDKIEEFKKEIQQLFDEKNKSVESFFEWRNKGNQKLEFGDVSLDVSGIISTHYNWEPLLNTQMDMKMCKNYAYYLFDKLFYYRKNQSKYSNDWSKITSNKKIFYAEKDVTNHRLAGIGWDGVVYKREHISVSPYDLKTYYDSSLLKKDPITKNDVEPDFDYRKEFEYLQDVIWNEIKDGCVDAHSVEIPKKQSTRYKLADGEIRGKFSTDPYMNKKVVKMTSELQKYRWRILTTDEEEYDKWKHFYAKFYDKKGYEVKNTFIAIFCSERDAKKIREICITPEEFLNSDFLKTLYLRREANNRKISTIGIQPFIKLHDMYKTKFQHVRHNNNRSTMVNFPYWLEDVLKNKYSTKHLEEMYERSVKFVNKHSTQESNIELLKYKLLYNFSNQKLNKLKEKCQ